MKSIKRAIISLVLTAFLLCSPAFAATAPVETEYSRVTLTFADVVQRAGYSAPDDVEVIYAAKGGPQLKFHLAPDELECGPSLQCQQATVRFGDSEWAHPGELTYKEEERALLYPPLSSSSQAHTHYRNESEDFGTSTRQLAASRFTDVAETDWFASYVNLCAEKELLNGVGNGRFDPNGIMNEDEALVMAARVLWQADGGTGPLPDGPSPEEFVTLLGEDGQNCPFAFNVETAARYADTWAWDGMTYLVSRAREENFPLDLQDGPVYPSSRRLFFQALAFAVQNMELTEINQVESVPGTRDSDILRLYRTGILSGTDVYGSFDGQRTLTRAEAATALARIAEPSLRVSFSLPPSPFQSYTLTKLATGTPAVGFPNTNLCALEEENDLHFLTLDGNRVPWPEGGTPSSAFEYHLNCLEIGVFATPEAALHGYGPINIGIMDGNGDFVVRLGTYSAVHPAQDGTFIACNSNNEQDSWFLLNPDGSLSAQLPQLGSGAVWWGFNNGLLPLQDAATGLFGFVDQAGSWALAPKWNNVSPEGFSSGYAAVQNGSGLWGIIDTEGNQVLPFQYQWIGRSENSAEYTGPGLFVTEAADAPDEVMWTSPHGTVIPTDPTFARFNYASYHNGYAVLQNHESYYSSYCYLDLTGQPVSETFEWAGPIGVDGQGFVGLDGAVYRIEFHS